MQLSRMAWRNCDFSRNYCSTAAQEARRNRSLYANSARPSSNQFSTMSAEHFAQNPPATITTRGSQKTEDEEEIISRCAYWRGFEDNLPPVMGPKKTTQETKSSLSRSESTRHVATETNNKVAQTLFRFCDLPSELRCRIVWHLFLIISPPFLGNIYRTDR